MPIPDTTAAESKATAEARAKTLALIQSAQSLLYEAAQASCPLHGWCEVWQQIGDHADATKDLWHTVNDAPRPTGHDEF